MARYRHPGGFWADEFVSCLRKVKHPTVGEAKAALHKVAYRNKWQGNPQRNEGLSIYKCIYSLGSIHYHVGHMHGESVNQVYAYKKPSDTINP